MSPRPSRPHIVTWACRLYGVMLWMFPPELRREYRHELLLAFRNELEHTLNRGTRSSLLILAAHIVKDWLNTVSLHAEAPEVVSVLGLESGGHEACGSADGSTVSVSLLLATLGVALLIGGWFEWLKWLSLKAEVMGGPHFIL